MNLLQLISYTKLLNIYIFIIIVILNQIKYTNEYNIIDFHNINYNNNDEFIIPTPTTPPSTKIIMYDNDNNEFYEQNSRLIMDDDMNHNYNCVNDHMDDECIMMPDDDYPSDSSNKPIEKRETRDIYKLILGIIDTYQKANENNIRRSIHKQLHRRSPIDSNE